MGRTVGEKKKLNPNSILKDLDFDRSITLGPEKRKKFLKQIDKDVKFLIAAGL